MVSGRNNMHFHTRHRRRYPTSPSNQNADVCMHQACTGKRRIRPWSIRPRGRSNPKTQSKGLGETMQKLAAHDLSIDSIHCYSQFNRLWTSQRLMVIAALRRREEARSTKRIPPVAFAINFVRTASVVLSMNFGRLLLSGFRQHILRVFLLLIAVFAATSKAEDVPSPLSDKNCPAALAQLPCNCTDLNTSSIQILCKQTNIELVFDALRGYNSPIDKLGIQKCESTTELLGQLPKLQIRSLDISKCAITKIDDRAFTSLADSLEELWLFRDSLINLPPLTGLRRLKTLNLNRNEIADIPDHSFDGLDRLQQLRLRSNRICSLQPNALNETKSTLQLLDLGRNCFGTVPAQALRNSMALVYLNLASNHIESIPKMQFMNLPKLMELRLNNNQLMRIAPTGFMNVPNLKHLFLEANALSTLDTGTLQVFKELELIDLGFNSFVKIPSFKELQKLIEVRMPNNRIQTIDTLTFSANPSLENIQLQNNQIDSIARNSFDSLDKLNSLMLGNNSLRTIERSMLDGMRNLRQLSLRNNSIVELNNQSFASVPDLTALDLSHNELTTIRPEVFSRLNRLDFLVLSDNDITTIDKDAFRGKVATILLDGNPLNCDAKLEPFVGYLVRNRVRTFLSGQPEVTCAAPVTKRGTRLKDLMMAKSNETFVNGMQSFGALPRATSGNQAAQDILSKLLPNLARNAQTGQNLMAGQQLLGSIARNFPAIQQLPGMNMLTTPHGPGAASPLGNIGARVAPNSKDLDSAIDQFAEPLVKFAQGNRPQPSDLNQLITTIPQLIVTVPGFGDVDVSKLSPKFLEYVLRGGEVPGIPRATIDYIIKQYMQRMYAAAAAAQGLTTTGVAPLPKGVDENNYLKPLTQLPHGLVKNVIDGTPLPHLTEEQTRVVKEYYTERIPFLTNSTADQEPLNITDLFSPRAIAMMRLLPPGYNFNKLPPELLKQVMAGEMPNMALLPVDLQQYIRDNFDKVIGQFGGSNTPNISVEELLRNLPQWERHPLATFSPYDINRVDADLVVQEDASLARTRLFTAIALGLVAAVTLAVLTGFCIYLKRNQLDGGTVSSLTPNSIPDVVREQSFRPSASSTLRSREPADL